MYFNVDDDDDDDDDVNVNDDVDDDGDVVVVVDDDDDDDDDDAAADDDDDDDDDDVEDHDVKGEEDDVDVEEKEDDDVEEEHFARACAVETHVKISGEPLYTNLYAITVKKHHSKSLEIMKHHETPLNTIKNPQTSFKTLKKLWCYRFRPFHRGQVPFTTPVQTSGSPVEKWRLASMTAPAVAINHPTGNGNRNDSTLFTVTGGW